MEASSLEKFNSLTPQEVEFSAEYEEIEIVPNFGCDARDLDLIEGQYGPFTPQLVTQVPLWLALFLKRRRKCTIRAPEWLHLDKLDQKLEDERSDEQGFQDLPYYFSEISELLFREAKDDVDKFHLVRERVADIVSVRRNKIFKGLSKLRSGAPVELGGICNVETCLIRGFMQNALGRYHKHDKAATDAQVRASQAAAVEAAAQRAQAQQR